MPRASSPRRPRCRRRSISRAAGIAIGKGLNRIYTRNFLSTLKPKSLAMAQRFPGLLDDERIRRVRTMYDFDDVVTSLLHGFDGATDYWRRASSKPWLASIARAHARAEREERSVRPERNRCRVGARSAATCCCCSPSTAGTSDS